MRNKNLFANVEKRHRVYIEHFCVQTEQKLVRIIPKSFEVEETHYVFSEFVNEGAYNIRGIFNTLEWPLENI